MNETTNLHLPQFAADDRIHHDDFNAAFAAIDAATARIVTGTYVGTGESGSEHPNTLTFDFAPKVIIVRKGYTTITQQLFIFSGMTSVPCQYQSNDSDRVTLSWSNGGKTISWYADNSLKQLNSLYEGDYYYLAVG